MRWEYLLLGTDKPYLSVTEEDDSDLDEDDEDNLVSLSHLWGWGGGASHPVLLHANLTNIPATGMCMEGDSPDRLTTDSSR